MEEIMKNTFKKITVICLIFLILSIYGTNICFADSNEAAETTEAKIYCKATIDDDFADNRVLIVLTHKASLEFKTYTLSDFAEIECASIKELTKETSAMVKNKLLNGGKSDTAFEVNVDQFRRIFCIELKTHSKENVLEAIRKLETREDILYASPDYIISICETIPNDVYYVNINNYQSADQLNVKKKSAKKDTLFPCDYLCATAYLAERAGFVRSEATE